MNENASIECEIFYSMPKKTRDKWRLLKKLTGNIGLPCNHCSHQQRSGYLCESQCEELWKIMKGETISFKEKIFKSRDKM